MAAVPVLDADAVRALIDDGDFDAAEALLAAHLGAVADAVAGGIAPADAEAWRALLAKQQRLIDVCRAGRDAARAALDRTADDRRGVIAWRKALA